MMIPIAKRNAYDLSSLIILNAKTYTQTPLSSRTDFAQSLAKNHQIFIGSGQEILAKKPLKKPYFNFMSEAFEQQTDGRIFVYAQHNKPKQYWVDITLNQQRIRMGFNQQRIGIMLPYAALFLLLALSAITWVTSITLIKKLTQPIKNLSQAAQIISKGEVPNPLKETGVQELAETAKAFNIMSNNIQELITTQTTLLNGISHDLRTPLTRLALTLELLNQNTDTQLIQEINNIQQEMQDIIQQYLDLSQPLEGATLKNINLYLFINQLTPLGANIHYSGSKKCNIYTYPQALKPILNNLINNALRYGAKKCVTVSWVCQPDTIEILITDQGEGIPQDKLKQVFEPFFRLENSRNQQRGGLGLGLAIVDKIAKKYHWEISLKPNQPTGIQATIKMPCLEQQI
jgi:two-component system osmolarity sensor histidine kinase EnvZ